MKKILLMLIALIVLSGLFAYSLGDMSFGEDTALEIMTWNIEWFPKCGSATMDSVATIIQSLDLDIYAIQEVSDTTAFKQMVDGIDNYEYYFYSRWFAGLAYVYKTDAIIVNNIFEIYTTEPYWRPFPRSPMVMDITYNGESYYVINNHFKAFGDGTINYSDPWDEEMRRYDACNYLRQYIETALPNEKVIVLGDMNDVITDNYPNNVFQEVLDDTENFLFADLDIANGPSNGWSYPGYPSHIDHIFITNELFEEFIADNSVIQTIRVGDYMAGGFTAYDTFVSDHYPVALKLHNTTAVDENNTELAYLELKNYPNPFNPTTTISFTSNKKGTATLDIYSLKGRHVRRLFDRIFPAGTHSVVWDGKDSKKCSLPSGVYFYKLSIGSDFISEKMVLMK